MSNITKVPSLLHKSSNIGHLYIRYCTVQLNLCKQESINNTVRVHLMRQKEN